MILKYPGLLKSFLLNKYLYADLIVTEKCNMRCSMCDYWTRKPSKEMNFTDYLSALAKLKKLGIKIISITGGEPLLRKDIFEIIKLFSKDFFVVLNTNGTLINKEIAEKLKNSGLFAISISIDSLTKKHDKQRGVSGTLAKALNAINLLKDSDINLSMKAVLTKLNENEIEDLIQFAKNNDIKIGFNFYTESMSNKNSNLNLSNHKKTINELLRLKRKYKDVIVSTRHYLERGLIYYKGSLPVCQAGLFYFCIFPDGNIYRCAKLKNEPIANMKKDSLDVIKQKIKEIKPTDCNSCWVSCRGEIDPFRTDFLNKVLSYLNFK